MTSSRCSACSAELPASARFCPACGRDALSSADTALAATAAAVPGDQPALPPVRLPAGTRLSVYRIESVLGEGGMGVVYRAQDEARSRVVALKCLHPNLAGDPEVRRRFVREARVLRSWSHPGVVAIHDFVEHEHLLAIVMEYVDGPTLSQQLAKWRGRMPFDEIHAIFGKLLDAMEDAHARGVVHRDLKPDNVLLSWDGDVPVPKIVDFGIAKIREGTTYTVSGAFLGTCRYMAPEQVKMPQLADHRADVYSLGVTLYQLCTGSVPFDGGNHFAVMMAHVSEAPPPPSTLRADLPPALERLLLDALAKDPAARPQSCAAFRARLDEALGSATRGAASLRASERPLPASVRDTDGYEMVLVPAGPFAMGPERRSVHLDAFYLDRLPVTNEQFKAFVDVTGYRPTDAGHARFLSHWPGGRMSPGAARHPVTYVSWLDAHAYAAWAGKRLPSEAEWEKAARGTDGRKYPWGRDEPGPGRANYGKARKGPTPVGAFPAGASPYGILDLAGNVWEWCDDVDDPGFYAEGPSHNPRNTARPEERALFVMRGGSWMYGPRSLRTFSRTSFEAHYRFASGGFRCARSA